MRKSGSSRGATCGASKPFEEQDKESTSAEPVGTLEYNASCAHEVAWRQVGEL